MKDLLKKTVILLVIPLASSWSLSAQNKRPTFYVSGDGSFQSVIRKARRLKSIPYRVGYGLQPGELHEISEEALRVGTIEEFKALLKDENPIIRVLGLFCLVKSVDPAAFAEIAKPLHFDLAQVSYTNGCILNLNATVGEIAQQLADGRFLIANGKRRE